jgi:hypothetical protein
MARAILLVVAADTGGGFQSEPKLRVSPSKGEREMWKPRFLSSAVAALVAGLGTAASAGQSYITNVGVESWTDVTVTGTINGGAISQDETATLIELTTTSGSVLPVFCVDLLHDIYAQDYNPPLAYFVAPVRTDSTGSASGTGNSLPPLVTGEIQALAELGGFYFTHGVSDPDNAFAGIQGAIWTLEYNTNGNSLSIEGGPTIDSLITADLTYAAARPANHSLGLYPGLEGKGFAGTTQGFSVGAPEASTWLMMVLGFAGLGYAGFRRPRKRSVSAFD